MALGYSGLADLAVPSWILCAGLVAPGGRLALVVPESWLSRDYAAVVHYLLLRWFEIEFVVEDEHAAWFSDAQVKTTLLVAKRIPRRKGAFDFPEGKSFLRIAISGTASGPSGPCSRLRQNKAEPEKFFASEAREWLISGASHEDDMVKAYHVPLARVASNLRGACSKQKWFASMGETNGDAGPVIPHELELWLARASSYPCLVSLASLGVCAGQGLRTGANSFFYAEMTKNGDLFFEKLRLNVKCQSPSKIALPVIRKQGDLPPGFVVDPEKTNGRVLDLRGYALPEDILSGGEIARAAYDEMPSSFADLVRAVSLINVGDEGDSKRIWELSAVAPNIRKGRPNEGIPSRFWYMLPDFARRHRPDVFIARINAGSPKAYLNKDAKCVVDANFATLWTEGDGLDSYALLALLNSAWTAVSLEYSAAVMGGGALKIEAAHIRRLPIPYLGSDLCASLSGLGKRLSRVSSENAVSALLEKIDSVVASAALGRAASSEDVAALRRLVEAGKTKREKHNNKGKSE